MVSSSAKLLLALTATCFMVAAAHALPQFRPSYFPRPGGFSPVLPQYAGQQGSASSSGSGQGQVGGNDADIGNRDNAPPPLPAPGMNNSLEDTQLSNRVQEWPRPNQPFWYLNQQHIAQHTGHRIPCVGQGCPPNNLGPAPQSSFLG